eukprot:scaffold88885_cov49-Phaeocystis_antarctica.AAC.1
MPYMFVTLEVSKLSGWLNDDANCRVERRAYDAGEVHLGGGRAWGSSGASGAQAGPDYKGWGQSARGAHPKHLVHVRDAGGNPAGNVRVEILQAAEEIAHVGDG